MLCAKGVGCPLTPHNNVFEVPHGVLMRVFPVAPRRICVQWFCGNVALSDAEVFPFLMA